MAIVGFNKNKEMKDSYASRLRELLKKVAELTDKLAQYQAKQESMETKKLWRFSVPTPNKTLPL
jgi:hypothetical protein